MNGWVFTVYKIEMWYKYDFTCNIQICANGAAFILA